MQYLVQDTPVKRMVLRTCLEVLVELSDGEVQCHRARGKRKRHVTENHGEDYGHNSLAKSSFG